MATRRITAIARAAALRSTDRWRVGAVVYRGSKVLGVGTNDMLRTSPRSWHPFKSRHAEFNAISDTGLDHLRGASIYVHRVGRDGLDHCAKPCPACQKMLAWTGVKDVEWSDHVDHP